MFKYDKIECEQQYQQYAMHLQLVEREVLIEQYSKLFDSLKLIGDYKAQEDHFDFTSQ